MSPQLIDTQEALDQALAWLRGQPRLALDTESDSFFAYRPRVCLLQVSVPEHDLLIDPLAEMELAPFGQVLADPATEVVLHAAENDVLMMERDFGWRIGRLYDTQVASFVLGIPPYSLAGILETRFGVKLNKKMQRSDWSRRPLELAQIKYAAEDTSHLLPLSEELQGLAREAGREEEIATECGRIAVRKWESPEPDPDAFRRTPGAKELDPVSLRVLRDLLRFREREAERRNRAAFRIVPDQALVALTRAHKPSGGRGVPERWFGPRREEIERIVRDARAKGPLPPPKRKPRPPRDPNARAVKRRYDGLRQWRAPVAEARGVEAFVVARNDMLLEIARRNCHTLDDLGQIVEPYRLREYGEAMLGAMLDSSAQGSDNTPSD